MAQKKGQRSRQAQADTQSRAARAPRGQPETIDTLRAQCERLKAELEAARTELEAFKTRHDDALNRIDWVIDSLKSLQESGD